MKDKEKCNKSMQERLRSEVDRIIADNVRTDENVQHSYPH